MLEGFNSQAARFDELLSAYTSGVHKLQQVLLELSEDVAPRCLRVLNEVCSDMCAGVRMSYSLSMSYSLFNHPDATAHLRPVSEHSFDQVLSQPNPNTLCRGGGGGEWLYGVSTPDCYQGAQTPPAPPEAAKRGGGGVCSREQGNRAAQGKGCLSTCRSQSPRLLACACRPCPLHPCPVIRSSSGTKCIRNIIAAMYVYYVILVQVSKVCRV